MTLAADALDHAGNVYRLIGRVHALLNSGRPSDEDEARELVSGLWSHVEPEIPVIKGIVATHRQAAQAFDQTRHSLAPFFLGRPEEHPDTPANDHTGPPDQPAPFVA